MSSSFPKRFRGPRHLRAALLWLLLISLDAATGEELADAPKPVKAAADLNARIDERELTPDDWEHWAFRSLRSPGLPEVTNANWAQVALDRFVQQRHEREGVEPFPAAAAVTWLRRVSFNLRGLPPTPEEVRDWEHDSSPDAKLRIVERWLASPAYGEHWARLWLDLARFAESDGFEHDLVRPDAWRYRDWVVEALNRDLSYDDFVAAQIAGDLHPERDPRALVATGFLLAGPDMPDLNLPEERRHVVLNEITATVGAAFLGLQFGCAECHDHKYDPISAGDFYRLRAFFEPLDLFTSQSLATVASSGQVSQGVSPRYLESVTRLEKGQKESRLTRTARAVREPQAENGQSARVVPAARYYERGDFRRPGPVVNAAVPRIVSRAFTRESATVQGRDQLARWLVADAAPLLDRVVVNRIWQEHFQTGLVASASDFGLLGDSPSHPELLDWLAVEFRRSSRHWKQLHRDVVLSATYGQASQKKAVLASQTDPGRMADAKQRDPANRWLVGMNRRRLDGDSLRDAVLAASGELVLGSPGPGVRPPLPPELVKTLLPGQWEESPAAADHRRRSVYLFVRRNMPFPWIATFDRPEPSASCAIRNRSTTAPQALTLWNSEFTFSAQQSLAGRLMREQTSASERVDRLFLATLGRRPSERECRESLEFVAERTAEYERRGVDVVALAPRLFREGESKNLEAIAWVDLSGVLLNLNEFLYLD
jgi:hypothetical protein